MIVEHTTRRPVVAAIAAALSHYLDRPVEIPAAESQCSPWRDAGRLESRDRRHVRIASRHDLDMLQR